MAEPEVVLLTAGRIHAGWKTMKLRRSMEHCAGSFALGVSERWSEQDEPRVVHAQQRCEVRVNGEVAVTGYVDEVELSIDAESHDVEVTGRDAAADLVDCSAIARAGQWRGRRIEQIAADLAAPFGVPVRAEVDTGKPLTSFALQEGETVFDAIERAARIRALLVISDTRGGLVITRAGVQRISTPLVLGGNLLHGRVRLDMRDRYSVYMLKGQAPGNDFFNGSAAAHIFAKALDPGVTRYRPNVITGDAPDVAATLQQRAMWEAKVREARSLSVDLVVQGWGHAGGLWAPNRLVPVIADRLRLDADLLITDVEFEMSPEAGTVTRLRATRPDAYKLLPIKQQDAAKGFWALPKAGG